MKPEIWVFLGVLVNSVTLIVMGYISFRMKQLERNTNSKMDQLMKVSGEAEKAKGNIEGRVELKNEQADKAQKNT